MENDGICASSLPVSQEYVGVQDAVRRVLLVEPEGASREYTVSEYICAESGLYVKNEFFYHLVYPISYCKISCIL